MCMRRSYATSSRSSSREFNESPPKIYIALFSLRHTVHIPMAVMVKSKCSSDACRLLDLSFPCRLTTLTTSKESRKKLFRIGDMTILLRSSYALLKKKKKRSLNTFTPSSFLRTSPSLRPCHTSCLWLLPHLTGPTYRYIPLTVVADEDGVLLELRNRLYVHQLVPGNDRGAAVDIIQLIRVKPMTGG